MAARQIEVSLRDLGLRALGFRDLIWVRVLGLRGAFWVWGLGFRVRLL